MGSVMSTVTLGPGTLPSPLNRDEFFDVTWSGQADAAGTGMGVITFMLDAPNNMCTLTAAMSTLVTLIGGTNTINAPSPQLTIANTPTGGTVTWMGPGPLGTTQGRDISVTITCT